MSDRKPNPFWRVVRCSAVLSVVGAMSAAVPARAADSDIIINEIMYHPPEDRDDLQYVELFNRGQTAVDLSGWTLKGVKFVFPDKTAMAPGAYLVLCRDRAAFARQYGTSMTVIGDFPGRLKHGGERIELEDAGGKTIDEVTYSDEEPWPVGPDGYSPSLERICPFVSGKEAHNWSASKMPVLESSAGTPGRRNDSFSSNRPPAISMGEFKTPAPGQPAPVTVEVTDPDGIKEVTLLYCLARTGGETTETAIAMQRIAGDEKKGTYQAAIAGQPEGALVRFRIQAQDAAGATRTLPSANEPRPTYSYSTFVNTNTARIAFAHVINVTQPPPEVQPPVRRSFLAQLFSPSPAQPPARPMFAPPAPSPARGNGAFIYIPPDGGEVHTFDHVRVRSRRGGFKVHFQKDRAFKGMTGINVIFDGPPRWVLSEALSFELYRMAGVKASATEHLRVWLDGRLLGYHLMVEQPNKAFLRRHVGDDSGNLYKLLWYGGNIVGQHEKKTNETTGHEDLLKLIEGLNRESGAQQWQFIQKSFDVEQFTNYYAVNMCIQNWDGFFNNYFTYHDTGGSGKWTIFPWDEDKTWGDYDGASRQYDWYEMPLTFGMKDDPSRGFGLRGQPGFFGRTPWWRPGGYFAEPLLANPQFRQRFLARLAEMCNSIFTEEKFLPVIDALEKRLEPEIAVRAQAEGRNAGTSLKAFHEHIQSFRNQLKYRRAFLLAEFKKASEAAPSGESNGDTTTNVNTPK